MIVVYSFGLLLPLTLLIMASSIICFAVGRPRVAWFFVFLAINFLRQFTYFTYIAYNEPVAASWIYSLLTSDVGYGCIWGGMLVTMVLAFWDFWRNLGGISGARDYTQKARATFKALRGTKIKNDD